MYYNGCKSRFKHIFHCHSIQRTHSWILFLPQKRFEWNDGASTSLFLLIGQAYFYTLLKINFTLRHIYVFIIGRNPPTLHVIFFLKSVLFSQIQVSLQSHFLTDFLVSARFLPRIAAAESHSYVLTYHFIDLYVFLFIRLSFYNNSGL